MIKKMRKKCTNYSMQIRLSLIFLMSVLMTACASEPLKAPCNQYATFCGTKTKINQW
jgi:hypothetical protein